MNTKTKVQNIDRNQDASDSKRIDGQRILQGLLMSLTILAAAAFWGTFVYALVVENVKLLNIFGHIIGIMIGVFVPVAVLVELYKKAKKFLA